MDGQSSSADNQTINQRLLEQYNEIAQLAGSLAHEIKNPLSVIRMNMDLLAEELDPPQTSAERRALQKTKIVQEQCMRLQNLLDDFLRFARLRQLNLLPGNLNEQVERVLDFVAAQAERQGIEIVRYLDADLPSIDLDAETLYSALLNLVINAIQAMPDGGTLMVRTQETRHGVALGLIDTGCGMNEETALHMFDAFYSTKDGGSGLGLPLARKIIDAHNARIDVQSELGRGTQFTLEFPKPARIGP
ncbi:sensor histidine kinase [Blastopirellula sp. JC732]|uniref:histidine kinase n=1 Tax=Blastopirellula sediminis TaxID=2894196 RepID=A0A9X1SIL7_9BACT|nr:ATP-binding protein [Blastopirellula sediminis]MCC9605293.1 sensor histidine kinase [Blastopirellula sediminis]MCC9631407.1 sensor histidine kinase [Blastopirellula sediminis]